MIEKSKDSINPKMFNEGNQSSHDFKQWIDIFYMQKNRSWAAFQERLIIWRKLEMRMNRLGYLLGCTPRE